MLSFRTNILTSFSFVGLTNFFISDIVNGKCYFTYFNIELVKQNVTH